VKTNQSLTVLDLPEWKSKILNAVAWLLGMRGEHVACITFSFDYRDKEVLRKINQEHVCQDCGKEECHVCKAN
jgi:hypothetical protein